MQLTEHDEKRFWSKVALPNGEGCMLWAGAPHRDGYGRFSLVGRDVYAHRISYVLAYGPIPDGLTIDHVKANGCTNRHCVAPLHLEAVTNAENVRRGDAGQHHKIKTHCVNGHAYDEANTYRRPNGGRDCRTCRQGRERAHAARQQAKAA